MMTYNQVSNGLENRISKVQAKAKAVRFFYFLGSLLLTVAAFFPILYGTSVGDMSVVNFWRPFLDLTNYKTSAIAILLNGGVSGLYALLLLISVINTLRALAKLFDGSKGNCNSYKVSMEKAGNLYSSTLIAFIVLPFMAHLISGAVFSTLYYIAIAVGVVLHLWLGLVDGNVSSLEIVGDSKLREHRRDFGRVAPFFRNLAQLVFVGIVMYFVAETNVMLNALRVLQTNDLLWVFRNGETNLFLYAGAPGLQFLCCIWTLVMLCHALRPTEFRVKPKTGVVRESDGTSYEVYNGQKLPGRKIFGIFSLLLLITSGALFGLTAYAHTVVPSIVAATGTLYIAVVALACCIEELFTCGLPAVKAKAEEKVLDEEKEAKEASRYTSVLGDGSAPYAAEEGEEPIPEQEGYHIPLQPITQPGVYMQPDGRPIMVMPMIAGPQYAPVPAENGQPVCGYQGAYANPYGQYWQNGRPVNVNPYEAVQEEAPAEEPVVEKTEKKKSKKNKKEETALVSGENPVAQERSAMERSLAEKWINKADRPNDGPVYGYQSPVYPWPYYPWFVPNPYGYAYMNVPNPYAYAQNPASAQQQTAAAPVSRAAVQAQDSVNAFVPAPVQQEPAYEEPKQAMMETYSYTYPWAPKPQRFYPEASGLTEEDLSKPLPPKKWTVTCPDCRSRLTVKDGAFAYRCPECGGVFQLRKIFRARQNQTGEKE